MIDLTGNYSKCYGIKKIGPIIRIFGVIFVRNIYNMYNYFCSQTCMHKFIKTHIQRVVAIAPRTEPLETLINDPKKTDRAYYGQWEINERGVDTQTE